MTGTQTTQNILVTVQAVSVGVSSAVAQITDLLNLVKTATPADVQGAMAAGGRHSTATRGERRWLS